MLLLLLFFVYGVSCITPEGLQTPAKICTVTARWPMRRVGQGGGGDTQDIDTLLEEAERVGHSEEVLKILRQTKADQDRGIYRGGTIFGGN